MHLGPDALLMIAGECIWTQMHSRGRWSMHLGPDALLMIAGECIWAQMPSGGVCRGHLGFFVHCDIIGTVV